MSNGWRCLSALSVICLTAVTPAHATEADVKEFKRCQILDNQLTPAYQIMLRTYTQSDVNGFDEMTLNEIEIKSLLGYYRLSVGELDLALHSRFISPGDDARLRLPELVGSVAVEAVWTVRNRSGTALQLRAAPGFYTDDEELNFESVNVPISVASIQVLNRDLSGIVGVQMWPGFETAFVPMVGVEWAISDALRLKAQIPESRLDWFVTRWLQTTLGCEWRPLGFWLHDPRESDRGYIELGDVISYVGVVCHITDDVFVRSELGYAFERTIKFKDSVGGFPHKADVDDALFFGIGFGGPF